jgi:hypothetical protein
MVIFFKQNFLTEQLVAESMGVMAGERLKACLNVSRAVQSKTLNTEAAKGRQLVTPALETLVITFRSSWAKFMGARKECSIREG